MSESINDARFGGVVWRHLHLYTIADGKANKTLAHLSRNVREHEMIVGQRDAKHRPGQDRHDRALESDRFC